MYPFNEQIVEAYKSIPLNARFNDHGLGVNVVKFATQEYTDQTKYINSFIQKTNIGSRAVAKWFGWNKTTGSFNVDLVKTRGLYNANELDRQIARLQVRGASILEDAGEKLIPKTFLIMHDICFKGKYSNRKADFDRIGRKVSFNVEVTSYIYSLDWDVDHMDEFYGTYYSSGCKDFIKQSNYSYTFQEKVTTQYSESSTNLSQRQLIQQVVGRCLDLNIAKLQTKYPAFRIITPIRSTSPLTADIGLKEGITSSTRFEVLEPEQNTEGIIKYHRKGIIKPIEGKVADNRYSVNANLSSESQFTEFEVLQGADIIEGMLIREID